VLASSGITRRERAVDTKGQHIVAMCEALRAKDGGSVSALVRAGFPINAPVLYGGSALIRSACDGHVDMCRLLLALGADVNLREENKAHGVGGSALTQAAKNHHIEVCRLLLDAGADVDVRGRRSATVLQVLLEEGPTSEAFLPLCKLLLERGADPNAKAIGFLRLEYCKAAEKVFGASGRTVVSPLHTAQFMPEIFFTAKLANVGLLRETVDLLLRFEADPSFVPEYPGSHFLTPLQLAVKAGSPEVLQQLLACEKADPGQKTLSGRTLTALARRPEIKEVLRADKTARAVAVSVGQSSVPISRNTLSLVL
jgi:hypothetical protein